MPISKITLKNFRCFESLDLELSPKTNFFYGKNGSGKTSVLEAIYLCSSGKSFKSSNISALINQNNKQGFKVKSFDSETGHIIEINKHQTKPIEIHYNNQKIPIAKLARKKPATAIHNQTFSFADASPDFRRKLLDRAIFISNKRFSHIWFGYYRSLKQRNALLKQNIANTDTWDESLIEHGESLNQIRQEFHNNTMKELKSLIENVSKTHKLTYLKDINITFRQGWDKDLSLRQCIQENTNNDKLRRTTTRGPHKADIKFYIGDIDAKQILSRGEQKLFSILWCCSQHKVLKNTHNLDPTLIIDDIKSELDNNLMSVFMEALNYIENQVIFSCIDDQFSSKINIKFEDFKKFHVEQLHY